MPVSAVSCSAFLSLSLSLSFSLSVSFVRGIMVIASRNDRAIPPSLVAEIDAHHRWLGIRPTGGSTNWSRSPDRFHQTIPRFRSDSAGSSCQHRFALTDRVIPFPAFQLVSISLRDTHCSFLRFVATNSKLPVNESFLVRSSIEKCRRGE